MLIPLINRGCLALNSRSRLLWDPYFELLSFLITSARGVIDEPQIYAPLRLLDAAVKLVELMEKESRATPELIELKKAILEKEQLVLSSEEEFIKALDELVLKLAEIIKKNLPKK